MAVTFATLFERLGKLFYYGEYVRLEQTGFKTIYADVMTKFTGADSELAKRTTNNLDMRVAQWGAAVSDYFSDANTTLIDMMDDDTTVDQLDNQAAIR